MMKNISRNSRHALILFIGLSGSRIGCRGQETISYRPAGGYYVCPEEDMVCTIVSCYLEDGCGDFMYNFEHVPDLFEEKDEQVFVSMGPHASITLGLGDAEEIICDTRCMCQPLNHDADGTCQLAPTTQMPSGAPTISIAPTHFSSSSPTLIPSDVPSSKPSVRPSSTPTNSPTHFPSSSPTMSPSDVPSSKPSLRPSSTPTNSPTHSPSSTPTIYSPIPKLLEEVSGSDVFQDQKSPHSRALQWLLQHDNFDYDPVNQASKLHQRYALVALDFAFHNNNISHLNWTDPNVDECLWDGVTCAHFNGVPYVRTIDWARRNLTGTPLPEFSLFPAIETLDLAQNNLQGPLDPFYSLEFLKNLYLFDNQFSGPIKDDVSKLNRLERLYLGQNELTGTLSSGLWQANKDRPMQWMVLHHNKFTGSLPMGMRLGHLRYLDLSHNSFSSTIPSDWPDRLITMRTLYLDHNKLTGSIPDNFARIGNGWLKQFYANDNKLTGRFPQGWDPIFYLTNIDIRNNRFTRDMPSSVCALSVFDTAEMVELRADCDICDCRKSQSLCDNCR